MVLTIAKLHLTAASNMMDKKEEEREEAAAENGLAMLKKQYLEPSHLGISAA